MMRRHPPIVLQEEDCRAPGSTRKGFPVGLTRFSTQLIGAEDRSGLVLGRLHFVPRIFHASRQACR